MRIVMVTDDVVIDRRILQEAETLIDQGHEVILIASGKESLPKFEWIGRVKVERVRRNILLTRTDSLRAKVLRIIQRFFVRTGRNIGRAIRFLAVRAGYILKRLALVVRSVVWRLLRKSILLPSERVILNRIRWYNPDVIHVHDLPCLKVSVCASHRLRTPLIYDAHELYPEINTLSRMQKRTLSRMEKRLVRHCDRIITVNPFIAEEIAKRYSIFEPTVIYNAIDRPEGFDPTVAPNRFRESMPIPAGDGILLYQGWMSKTRGLQDLVRAMKMVDDNVHLVMMGYGEARDELEQIVREENLGERVHFKEAVGQDELLYWTASADAGIIPYQPIDLNNYYSSPNKLFEFIQASLPIIANDLPFLRKVVAGEGFGVVARLQSPKQYAGAIDEMFDASQGGPGRFRNRLLKRASEYNWANEEKKISAIYNQIRSVESE
ncbi:MAG: glycosyltransferase family 4 protein [Planctomycetota bacterium]|nr:glycosyltransferase family 4 protein [Planctomycetota bacterium]